MLLLRGIYRMERKKNIFILSSTMKCLYRHLLLKTFFGVINLFIIYFLRNILCCFFLPRKLFGTNFSHTHNFLPHFSTELSIRRAYLKHVWGVFFIFLRVLPYVQMTRKEEKFNRNLSKKREIFTRCNC